jgi:hypothetical protein
MLSSKKGTGGSTVRVPCTVFEFLVPKPIGSAFFISGLRVKLESILGINEKIFISQPIE